MKKKATKPFVKLFGSGEGQILIVIREGGIEPSISLTVQIPNMGIVDSKFIYDDTDEGYKQARSRFDAIDEKVAQSLASNVRKTLQA